MDATQFYTSGEYLKNKPDLDSGHSAWKAAMLLRTIARLSTLPTTIVEVGCGSGGVLHALAGKLPQTTRLLGLDISPQIIEIARRHCDDRISFRVGGVTAVPQCDLVVVADVIEHVENPFEFVRAIRERSSAAAFLIPLDMNVDFLLRPSKLLGLRAEVGHIHYFSKSTALALLRDSGVNVVSHEVVNMYLDEPGPDFSLRVRRALKRTAFRMFPELVPRLLGMFTLCALTDNARPE